MKLNHLLAFKETLNNVSKHAAATEVQVLLVLAKSGFPFPWKTMVGALIRPPPACRQKIKDPLRLRSSGGNGLMNLRKRIKQIGGECQIDSASGKGTPVKFIVFMAFT